MVNMPNRCFYFSTALCGCPGGGVIWSGDPKCGYLVQVAPDPMFQAVSQLPVAGTVDWSAFVAPLMAPPQDGLGMPFQWAGVPSMPPPMGGLGGPASTSSSGSMVPSVPPPMGGLGGLTNLPPRTTVAPSMSPPMGGLGGPGSFPRWTVDPTVLPSMGSRGWPEGIEPRHLLPGHCPLDGRVFFRVN